MKTSIELDYSTEIAETMSTNERLCMEQVAFNEAIEGIMEGYWNGEVDYAYSGGLITVHWKLEGGVSWNE